VTVFDSQGVVERIGTAQHALLHLRHCVIQRAVPAES
jgi:hypothetical protein